MSYSKSNARIVYDGFSGQLLSLAKSTNAIPAAILTYNHKDLIYKSLVVLLCSSIEEYHKTFIEDWFYKLRSSGVNMNKIPVNARMLGFLHNTEHHYKNFLYDRDSEKDIIENVGITSKTLTQIANLSGKSLYELSKEIENRKLILKHMLNHKIHNVNDVNAVLALYYDNPQKVLNRVILNR